MGKFEFRLEASLRLSRNKEDQAKMYLGECLQELEREKDELKKTENKKHETEETIASLDKMTVDEFQSYDRFLDFLRKKIGEQLIRIQKAEEKVLEARLDLAQSIKERKILENLKERQKLEHAYEEEKKAQSELDQIATNIYTSSIQGSQE